MDLARQVAARPVDLLPWLDRTDPAWTPARDDTLATWFRAREEVIRGDVLRYRKQRREALAAYGPGAAHQPAGVDGFPLRPPAALPAEPVSRNRGKTRALCRLSGLRFGDALEIRDSSPFRRPFAQEVRPRMQGWRCWKPGPAACSGQRNSQPLIQAALVSGTCRPLTAATRRKSPSRGQARTRLRAAGSRCRRCCACCRR